MLEQLIMEATKQLPPEVAILVAKYMPAVNYSELLAEVCTNLDIDQSKVVTYLYAVANLESVRVSLTEAVVKSIREEILRL